MKRLVVIACLVGCGSAAHPDGAGRDRKLGMNDVTMLVPLPESPDVPALVAITGDEQPLVPANLFNPLVVDPIDIAPKLGGRVEYAAHHVVGVRFDLCRHDFAKPCIDDEDGRLRLVLQPVHTLSDGTVSTHDIALHAFYPIPAADLAEVVSELRVLGRMLDVPLDSPLVPNAALADPDSEYAVRLRALVTRYARAERLVRLTVIGQHADTAAFAWILRGVHLGDAGWAAITIPETRNGLKQTVHLGGGDTIYAVTPSTDSPPGFGYAINGDLFNGASADEKRFALEALATITNPTKRGAGDTQCLACHVSTYLSRRRAEAAGIDPATLSNAFSSGYNVAVDSVASTDPRVVRALGWAGALPAISQRVAYETAVVLHEMEQRFPPSKN